MLLDEMTPFPTTESFALVMECFCRNTSKSKSHVILSKLRGIIEQMNELATTHDVNTKLIQMIKA
jgi:hypothetical protein